MFTGIIASVGRIVKAAPSPGGMRLRIAAGGLPLDDVAIGDSIAVNGICLTVTSLDGGFEVDVSRETLSCTAGLAENADVNLEKAMRLSDRLGGHLVSGHVDGVGTVTRLESTGDNALLAVSLLPELLRFVARKGSVTVDGVSLTVNEVAATEFAVNLIPHTLTATNLRRLTVGSRVNVEVDMLARYVDRLLGSRS
jgi:riboflavin synthase